MSPILLNGLGTGLALSAAWTHNVELLVVAIVLLVISIIALVHNGAT